MYILSDEIYSLGHLFSMLYRLIKKLEEAKVDITWFEEPLVPEDLEGYRTLRYGPTISWIYNKIDTS